MNFTKEELQSIFAATNSQYWDWFLAFKRAEEKGDVLGKKIYGEARDKYALISTKIDDVLKSLD